MRSRRPVVAEQGAEPVMSHEEWEEKRRHKRRPSDLKVRFRSLRDPAARYAEGVITNVSGGGLFVGTSRPLTVGDDVHLIIDVVTPLGENEQIDIDARVIWVKHKTNDEGMGLQFTRIERHSKYTILACAHRGQE